jgi:hypothetical protein
VREHVLQVAFLERFAQSLQQLSLGTGVRGAFALGDQPNGSPFEIGFSRNFS